MLTVPFVVRIAAADETARLGEAPRQYVARVTRAKLDAVRAMDLGAAGGVLVADTIVVAPDGGLLGKPRDDDDAIAMVERLAGATHEVVTHFILAERDPASAPVHERTVTTHVTFRFIERVEVTAYVDTGEGRDKAGAYALQGGAALFAERIDGSFTNVVGLPICEVLVAMRALGWVGAAGA